MEIIEGEKVPREYQIKSQTVGLLYYRTAE